MDELQELRERLKDRRLYVVAEKTGLSYQGILNIFNGVTKRPSPHTIDKLREYLDANK